MKDPNREDGVEESLGTSARGIEIEVFNAGEGRGEHGMVSNGEWKA